MLDSAIPEHLQSDRTLAAKTPADFNPPYPSYSARFPKNASELVMVIVGTQYRSFNDVDGAAQSTLSSFLSSAESPPTFSEWASVTDNRGFYNMTALAYWPSKAAYETWASHSGFQDWWDALQPEDCQHGWFLEVFLPTLDRFETIFNTQTPEASAYMREGWSGEVQEHAYWGSMRDRLAAGQTDNLTGTKYKDQTELPQDTAFGGRVKIPGTKNLAVIRSGQDWSETTPEERDLYLKTMHPVLIKGMDFLRDRGDEVGCFSCRFMDIADPVTGKADKDRTFGLAYFDDLASLESWCKDHPTHLAIFGGFHQYARKLQGNVTLRVFHEVLVLEPEQQHLEYIGCHPGTGMLVTHSAGPRD